MKSASRSSFTMPARAVTGIKVVVFLMLLAPAGQLVWQGFQTYKGIGDGLGVNPVEAVTHRTGDLTLYCLLATLAVTPLRRLLGQAWLIKLRRMLGLFAFFYGSLHFATYFCDQIFMQDEGLNLKAVARDIVKRPYITVGTLAYLLMVPLAITSTTAMIRRLGRRWQTLHRLIYVTALLGILHWTWLVKADLRRPLAFGFLLLVLLGVRGFVSLRKKSAG
ncbi:MAG TPA: protein-methionine-sulfoxide reductase heme-binding subunit MsrQ [Pseudomonadota bacterium]|nr:protein-methionine-sulfoxide reductase heme-binding subunit MsrQ [Pseudomonadota bacterium]